ncbi:phosphonate metabolism transcriptional regulator PhnF [Aureimonas sp. SA4125]|uniref:phosphonate metabolism transcriptional regulator PhnF n=1 Tax=Aureimonas sp. SA4125 TaxID=2826993 RepID=UPI001CC6C80E|nr:phosphonate metabolism transcriptional regulator PhnF [Aureimonas sp. SA4125]BDA85640.1 phosphonate metabolism transcriptional regulator PhnF [Aureimonas sp. SA4125]
MIAGDEGIARWRKVADAIRAMIADSEGAMDQLPVEAVLADRFQVNRHTVRRAIAVLQAEGIVRAERGRGTFVERRPARIAYPVGARTRFSENITSQSRQPAGRLISSGREPATAAIAGELGLKPGAPLHRLETLNVADGLPMSIATSWFPAERFPGIIAAYAETGSITRALAAEGVDDYRRKETRVSAARVSARDAEHLACPADAVVLVTDSVNLDTEHQPIQFSRARFLADRIEMVFRT